MSATTEIDLKISMISNSNKFTDQKPGLLSAFKTYGNAKLGVFKRFYLFVRERARAQAGGAAGRERSRLH